MSGMISERSREPRLVRAVAAARTTCSRTSRSGAELDRGYLISAKDLAAHGPSAPRSRRSGVGCLKVEGRKKKPEYVATVTHGYRDWLDRRRGRATWSAPHGGRSASRWCRSTAAASRAACTAAARDATTSPATQPDNRGRRAGRRRRARRGGELLVEVREPLRGRRRRRLRAADRRVARRAWASPSPRCARSAARGGMHPPGDRAAARRVPLGLARRAHVAGGAARARPRELRVARAMPGLTRRTALDVRVFGSAGGPLKAVFRAGRGRGHGARRRAARAGVASARSTSPQLREQLGRLGETPFALGALDVQGLGDGALPPRQRAESPAAGGDRRAAAPARLGAAGGARRARGADRDGARPGAAAGGARRADARCGERVGCG